MFHGGNSHYRGPNISSQFTCPVISFYSSCQEHWREHTSPFFSLAERGHYPFNERQRSDQQDPLRGSAGDQVIGRCFICTHEGDPGGGVCRYGSTSRVEGVGDSGTAEGIKRKVILFVMSTYCRCVCVYVCMYQSMTLNVCTRTCVFANTYHVVTTYLTLPTISRTFHYSSLHYPSPYVPLFLSIPLLLSHFPTSLPSSLPLLPSYSCPSPPRHTKFVGCVYSLTYCSMLMSTVCIHLCIYMGVSVWCGMTLPSPHMQR